MIHFPTLLSVHSSSGSHSFSLGDPEVFFFNFISTHFFSSSSYRFGNRLVDFIHEKTSCVGRLL